MGRFVVRCACAGVVALAAVAGCRKTKTDSTSVVVRIASPDLAPGVDIDAVDVTVKTAQQQTFVLAGTAANGQQTWPIQFDLTPADDAAASFSVSARARKGDKTLVETSARAAFVPGKVQLLKLWLYRACIGDTTCAAQARVCAVAASKTTCVDPASPDIGDYDPGQVVSGVDAAAVTGTDGGGHDAVATNDGGGGSVQDARASDDCGDASCKVSCAAGADGSCGLCMPNATHCPAGASTLYTCAANGTTETVSSCSPYQCSSNGNNCQTCTPGYSCVGATSRFCSSDGQTTTDTVCDAQVGGCDAATGLCKGCTKNQPVSCVNGKQSLCNATGTGTNPTPVTCPYGCAADGKTCNTCSPGAKQCSGAILQSCNGTAWVTNQDCGAFGCDATNKACFTCNNPGNTRCAAGSTTILETCTAGYWTTYNCASAVSTPPYTCFVISGTQATCRRCTPNSYWCSDDKTAVNDCGSDGVGITTTTCRWGNNITSCTDRGPTGHAECKCDINGNQRCSDGTNPGAGYYRQICTNNGTNGANAAELTWSAPEACTPYCTSNPSTDCL